MDLLLISFIALGAVADTTVVADYDSKRCYMENRYYQKPKLSIDKQEYKRWKKSIGGGRSFKMKAFGCFCITNIIRNLYHFGVNKQCRRVIVNFAVREIAHLTNIPYNFNFKDRFAALKTYLRERGVVENPELTPEQNEFIMRVLYFEVVMPLIHLDSLVKARAIEKLCNELDNNDGKMSA